MRFAPTSLAMMLAVTLGAVAAGSGASRADKLDDIIKAKQIRCGIMLDFPPNGYRDANNNPVGYDVEVCQDMAKALVVEAVIVETPSADRIPALLSNRVDVSVSGATNSLERAKVVGFSIPYQIWDYSVVVPKNSDIKSFDDLKGRTVGSVRGTTPEVYWLDVYKKWNDPKGTYHAYGSDGDMFLAIEQKKIDALIEGTVGVGAWLQTPEGQGFKLCCKAPFPEDWTGIMVQRHEQGLLNWVNLFIWHEVKEGRMPELYKKWWGVDMPPLLLQNVYW